MKRKFGFLSLISDRKDRIPFSSKSLRSRLCSSVAKDKNKFISGQYVFDFNILVEGNVHAKLESKDKALIADANGIIETCAIQNFHANFKGEIKLSLQDLYKFLGRTKEGQVYMQKYRTVYSFWMSTFIGFKGLDLTEAEIQSIMDKQITANALRKEANDSVVAMSRRHANERLAVHEPLIKFIHVSSQLSVISLINSTNLTVEQSIELRRIVDEDARTLRENEMVIALKNKMIARVKEGKLTIDDVRNLFG